MIASYSSPFEEADGSMCRTLSFEKRGIRTFAGVTGHDKSELSVRISKTRTSKWRKIWTER